MAENPSATKIRAKRIELHYFKRLHPLRRWKLILSIALPLIAAAWLIAHGVRGDQRIYANGGLSRAHAMFWARCSECHGSRVSEGGPTNGPQAGSFFLKVTDEACLVCHDGPKHHDAQAVDPGCPSCHVEHKGRVELAAFRDAQCIRCHADLPAQTKSGTVSAFAPKIHDFASASGHPEFAVAMREKDTFVRVRLDRTAEVKDTAQIKLNHEKHLAPGLKGLQDLKALHGSQGILERPGGLQLGCAFCHQVDTSRVAMQPIAYSKHCASCHALDVDARLPGAVAPHDTPALVHAYLRSLFIEAFERCQAPSQDAKSRRQCQDLELVKAEEAPRGRPPERGQEAPEGKDGATADQPRGRRLLRSEPTEEPVSDRPRGLRGRSDEPEPKTAPAAMAGPSALEWAAPQFRGAEKVMFKQNCEMCHTMTAAADRLPQVVPPAIPVRWLPHSVFDHRTHRPLACTECHKATVSKETTDVLLPSVTVCRECHRERGGARTGCVECHRYHDKAKERDPSGPLTVPQLVTGSPPAAGPGEGKRPAR